MEVNVLVVNYKVILIELMYEVFMNFLVKEFEGIEKDIIEENI